LTYDDLAAYLRIDIDDFTDDEARLMEKVSCHFDECDRCAAAFNEMMCRQSVAELLLGEPVPLGRNAMSLPEAVKGNNLIDIASAALNKLIDTVGELGGEALDIVDLYMTKGFTVEEAFCAPLAPSLSASRGASGHDAGQRLKVDEGRHSVTLEGGGRLMLTSSGPNASSALVVGQDGDFVRMYQLIDDGATCTVTTEVLPEGEYRIVILHDKNG